MQRIVAYRLKADECRALAARAERIGDRESLLALARSWERMAEIGAEARAPSGDPKPRPHPAWWKGLVEPRGVEPLTSTLRT